MNAVHRLSTSERLAALAGLAAAVASIVGFVPGLYRDPPPVVGQSHGYDVGNLVAVAVLGLGLIWSARGSLGGRLIAVGALGCLLYSFVTYAFDITLNPATFLYIAVLGFGVWSLAIGLAKVSDAEVEQALDGRLARRTTAGFMLVVSTLFTLTWLGQMWSALLSGQLPAELTDAGWPMNPVWVLDLGFVLPLMALTAIGLLTGRPQASRLAVPLLIFMALLGVTILAMAFSAALDGQPLAVPMVAIFAVVVVASSALAADALMPRRQSRQQLQHAHVR